MAVIYTTAAGPAFLGMQDNRRFAFLGIWDENVYLAGFDTLVASITFLGVKYYRNIGSRDIGQSVYFLGHIFLLFIVRFQRHSYFSVIAGIAASREADLKSVTIVLRNKVILPQANYTIVSAVSTLHNIKLLNIKNHIAHTLFQNH
jgi:hypothetical protein